MRKLVFLAALIGFCFNSLKAQQSKDEVLVELNKKSEAYASIAQNIWEFAEMGYLEEKSSALLQKTMSDEGFTIKKGVAGIPTAFIAEYGSGAPIIAILGNMTRFQAYRKRRYLRENLQIRRLDMDVVTIFLVLLLQRQL